jgi:hypothetical protein
MIATVVLANAIVKYDFRLSMLSEASHVGLADQNLDQERYLQSCDSLPLEFENHFTLPSWKEGPILQFIERSIMFDADIADSR